MQLGPPAQHLATGTARLGFLLQSRRLACPTQLAFAREGYSREQRSLSIQEGDALLASQFHPKNAPLRPEDVRLGSNKDVLWLCKCQKCGHPHEWAASPERRFTLGNGCPMCAGARPCKCNSLATLRPELLDSWDTEGNGQLTPNDVGISSHKRVRWLCNKQQSHPGWTATPKNRCRGSGCPLCAQAARQNKSARPLLSEAAPHLLKEFATGLNGTLDPETITTGSGRRLWWQCRHGCRTCGHQHQWQAVVSDRALRESNCPFCAGQRPCSCNSLAALHGTLVKTQWDVARNLPMRPEDLLPRSQRKVWWLCKEHAEPCSWQAAPDTRTGPLQTGCPTCAINTRRAALMRKPGRMQLAVPVQA